MSEWKRDENGRLYREFGNNCREYETDYIFTGKRETKKDKEQQEQNTMRCPFRSMINDRCTREQCAFFVQSKSCCVLAALASGPVHDTAGKKCPINRERRFCDNKCALYKNGCMVTAIVERK